MTDDRAWIEDVTGSKVVGLQPAPTGRSRGTWFVTLEGGDGPRELVLRRDTGDGPVSGTELTLGREAAVYRALAATNVPVPRIVAVAEDGQAVLSERARGSEDILSLPADARDEVMESFLRVLADLHRLDVTSLGLPFAVPATPEEHASLDIDMWQRMLVAKGAPNPMLEFTFGWLRRHAQSLVSRTVLCHGDCGPGNFLHDGSSVTAVLDWEFAHFGDPMDDLAWVSMRSSFAGDLKVERVFDRYTELTGTKVDPSSVDYYRAVVYARMAVCCAIAIQNRARLGTAHMEISTHLTLLPTLTVVLPRMIATLAGIQEGAPDVAAAATDPADFVWDVVTNDYRSIVLPAVADPPAAMRAEGLMMLMEHLRASSRFGPVVRAAELEDLREVLREPFSTTDEAQRALLDRVREVRPEDDEKLLRYFVRAGARQAVLWPSAGAMAEAMAPSGPA